MQSTKFLGVVSLTPNFRFIVALAAFVAACIAPAAAATLHPGDKVNVVVYYHPELSSDGVLVQGDGTIQLPIAGSVQTLGLRTDQLARLIQKRLAPYVLGVAVRVALETQGEVIFIAGGPSGIILYHPGEGLTTVIDQLQYSPNQRPERLTPDPYNVPLNSQQTSQAPLDLTSGPTDFKRVSVLRDGRELGPFDVIALRDTGAPGITLQAGDTVQLQNKPVRVVVGGDVAQPGSVYLYPDEPLMHAIDQAGGTTVTSTQTKLTIVRDGTSQIATLGDDIFAAPAVNGDHISVPRAPRIDVLGTVVRPGETYLRGNQTLVSAIYYAGGPDKYANLKAVQVFHDGVKTEYNLAHLQKGHEGDNPPLVDGDVVFVPQGSTIDAFTIFQALATLGFLGAAAANR